MSMGCLSAGEPDFRRGQGWMDENPASARARALDGSRPRAPAGRAAPGLSWVVRRRLAPAAPGPRWASVGSFAVRRLASVGADHAGDLGHRGATRAHLLQPVVAQARHALAAGEIADLLGGAPFERH